MSDDPSSANARALQQTPTSETLYRSLIEQLPALTYICDAERRTTYVYAEQVDRLLVLTDADRDAMRLNFGLESSSERIALAGGDFVVKSAPGEGTNVRFTIPLAAA